MSLANSGDLNEILITFANSLAPDEDQHSVSPDLDQNRFTHTLIKLILKTNQRTACRLIPVFTELKIHYV